MDHMNICENGISSRSKRVSVESLIIVRNMPHKNEK